MTIQFNRGDAMTESLAAACLQDGATTADQSEAALHFVADKLGEELAKVPAHQAFDALRNIARRYPRATRLAFVADFTKGA